MNRSQRTKRKQTLTRTHPKHVQLMVPSVSQDFSNLWGFFFVFGGDLNQIFLRNRSIFQSSVTLEMKWTLNISDSGAEEEFCDPV